MWDPDIGRELLHETRAEVERHAETYDAANKQMGCT